MRFIRTVISVLNLRQVPIFKTPSPENVAKFRFCQNRSQTCFKCLDPIQVLQTDQPVSVPSPSLIRSCHPAERRGRDDGSVPTTNSSRRHLAQHGHRSRPSGGQAFWTTTAAGIRHISGATHGGGEAFWEKTDKRGGGEERIPPPLLVVSYFVGKCIFVALNC